MAGVGTALDTASNLLAHYEQQAREGHLSTLEAQRQAAQVVSALRYLGDNYLLILDLEHRMVMHPTTPALVGKPLADFKDVNGKLFAREMVASARERGRLPSNTGSRGQVRSSPSTRFQRLRCSSPGAGCWPAASTRRMCAVR
ncbi:cache domain-containing protein [Pseudomonas brassicae]|uniref:cache domain-containing protein n=1 Tax=Pseudomonas brassicae TaxID=2708063 RepID=UPI0024436A58|nr:cache domain-containing protein [Pseudomonas brassicae]